MSELLRKLRWLMRRSDREAEFREELEFHLQEEASEREAEGMTATDALIAARRYLGNSTLLREDARAAWGWPRIEQLARDVRYALRGMRRSPAFTATAVLSLALGIGANTAIFSLLHALLMRALPVPQPEQLVQLTLTTPMWDTGFSGAHTLFGYPQLERFRQSKALASVFGGTSIGRVNVEYAGAPGAARADACTTNFFAALGLAPQRGRLFADGDSQVAVLSDRYWRTRFNADANVIGRTVGINRVQFVIAGVAPLEFSGMSVGSRPDLWVPLRALDQLQPDASRWTQPFRSWLFLAGRLRAGVTREQAQPELDALHRQLMEQELPASGMRDLPNIRQFARHARIRLVPASTGTYSGLRDHYTFALATLMSVAAMVLLVACANLASLLLARGTSRQREIALRMALGAGRGRVTQQLLTESLMLAAMGGALGLVLAWAGASALIRMIGDPAPLELHPEWALFIFAAAVSALTGICFGLVPALRATRIDPGPRSTSLTWDRPLIVAQIALSFVLVMTAGLFARSIGALWRVPTGYDRNNVLLFSIDARLAGYEEDRAAVAYRRVLDALRNSPDVRSAGASIARPVDDAFALVDQVNEVDGRRMTDGGEVRVTWNAITPGYFDTLGIPLKHGRGFRFNDDEGAPRVAIVNESLARRLFPARDPLGHRIGDTTVIGVVKDTRDTGLRDHPSPSIYYPLFQHGPGQEYRWGFVSYAVRYRTRPPNADAIVRKADRALPVFRVTTLDAQIEHAMLRERLMAGISACFGILALMLACVGLYGMMAYTVARRTAEFGIRAALGARSGQLLWLVVRRAVGLTALGIALGAPFAILAAAQARTMLFAVRATDPVTLAASAVILLAVAAVSACLPARRALHASPMAALRCE